MAVTVKNIDILLITDVKMDHILLKAQFHLTRYLTYRLDRNNKGGRVHQGTTSYWNDRKGEKVLDKSRHCSKLLTDLSIALEYYPYDLVVVRANAMASRINFLNLVFKYLNNRKQRVKINSTRSSFETFICGFAKGSIRG